MDFLPSLFHIILTKQWLNSLSWESPWHSQESVYNIQPNSQHLSQTCSKGNKTCPKGLDCSALGGAAPLKTNLFKLCNILLSPSQDLNANSKVNRLPYAHQGRDFLKQQLKVFTCDSCAISSYICWVQDGTVPFLGSWWRLWTARVCVDRSD